MSYELYAKISELRGLINSPEDATIFLNELGSKQSLFDMVSINKLIFDGALYAFPSRIKGVDAKNIGCVKSKCYVYLRKDLFSKSVWVIPLTRNDVVLQHTSGFDEVNYKEWVDYAVWSHSFTYPSGKSKLYRVASDMIHDEGETCLGGGCTMKPYVEMVYEANVYLYFRRATCSQFEPGKEYKILINDKVRDVLAVWCRINDFEEDTYIGFRRKNENGEYEPYNDYTCDNTSLLDELGIPIAILY